MMQPDLIRRQLATQATLDKFRGKPFDWAKGRHCGALLRFHLAAMGHPKPKLEQMRSALGARRALAARGCADMAEICRLFLNLEAIAPARMLMGDLVVSASADGIGGVLICAGPNKVFGWSEDSPRLAVWDCEFGQFGEAYRV